MVDSISNVSPKGAHTSLFVSGTNEYCHHGHIAETGIIEHLTQSVYAMYNASSKAMGTSVPTISLGEIKRFTLYFLPKIEETIKTSVRIVSDNKGSALINATATVGGEVAASCMMKFFIKGA